METDKCRSGSGRPLCTPIAAHAAAASHAHSPRGRQCAATTESRRPASSQSKVCSVTTVGRRRMPRWSPRSKLCRQFCTASMTSTSAHRSDWRRGSTRNFHRDDDSGKLRRRELPDVTWARGSIRKWRGTRRTQRCRVILSELRTQHRCCQFYTQSTQQNCVTYTHWHTASQIKVRIVNDYNWNND